MNRQIRVLLTGASGTIGREVLKQLLLAKKYRVTVLDLKTYDSAVFLTPFKNKIRLFYGDITNPEDIEKVTSDTDVVIHLAAVLPRSADINPEKAYKVNYGGTCNLIKSLQEKSPDCHFFYASSISVYGNRFYNPGMNTSHKLYPDTHYADTKVLCEQFIQQSSLNWSIFRICTILGSNYAIDHSIFERSLNSLMEFITPKDAAKALMLAVEKRKKLINSVYNFGGGRSCRITYHDFLIKLFDIYGLGKFNFPQTAFSRQKCSNRFFSDSTVLNEILNFYPDKLTTYFNEMKKSIPFIQRGITHAFSPVLKRYLLSKSVPYKSYRNNKKESRTNFSPVYA